MKVLQTSTPAQLRRFREEPTILACLSHPNIVVLEDIGGVPDPGIGSWNACIFTKLADHNLLDFYASYSLLGISGLDEAVAQAVTYQILSALTYLHDRKLVHKDLKPANILVFHNSKSPHLTFQISDFGLAAHFFEDESMPAPVARYTAPELLFCDYDSEQVRKADFWALGQVCKDLCTQTLVPPHMESRLMSSWAKETTDWMLLDDVKKRPPAKECRESVWVRQGERISPGF
jgi:serine/threonine protein kinase